jgi:hypothetical protein
VLRKKKPQAFSVTDAGFPSARLARFAVDVEEVTSKRMRRF